MAALYVLLAIMLGLPVETVQFFLKERLISISVAVALAGVFAILINKIRKIMEIFE